MKHSYHEMGNVKVNSDGYVREVPEDPVPAWVGYSVLGLLLFVWFGLLGTCLIKNKKYRKCCMVKKKKKTHHSVELQSTQTPCHTENVIQGQPRHELAS